jgi:hypothetical protein
MLQRFCSTAFRFAPNAEEAAAIDRLAAAHAAIVVVDDELDVTSDPGQAACTAYLETLESMSECLGLAAAPRTYRANFSANYRALFPDQARRYRVDIFEASVDKHAPIWVNGTKFELSREALGHADAVQQAWAQMGELLQRWRCELEHRRPGRSDFTSRLAALDMAWASFEHRYVAELIWIEKQARKLIVEAIQCEVQLRLAEEREDRCMSADATRSLVKSIQQLNAVANVRRKGRDDLGVDILESALETLRRCDSQELGNVEACVPARTLASEVVESFEAMRKYLREASRCLERVDPHLCNNAGLATRLADWEESWEMGAKYVCQTDILTGICDAVAEIRAVQRVAPELSTMIDDCDVELFLVLPRLLWLRFAAAATPNEDKKVAAAAAAIVRTLLPHRFLPAAACGEGRKEPCAELRAFVAQFRRAADIVSGTLETQGYAQGAAAEAALAELTRRAVAGTARGTVEGEVDPVLRATEDLMRELEGWSVELQRHCPEEWNQCSALLVQCLSGGGAGQPPRADAADFVV